MATARRHRRRGSRGPSGSAGLPGLSPEHFAGKRDSDQSGNAGATVSDHRRLLRGGLWGNPRDHFLRQFEVTLDLAHNRLFLKKDSGFKPDPYRYTTIGIQFANDPNGDHVVMSVWKDSPAEEAGMKAGDRIKAVNGQSARDLSLEQLGNQLHGPEGTPVRLIVERGSVSFAVTIRTRQMLCSSENVRNALRAAQK